MEDSGWIYRRERHQHEKAAASTFDHTPEQAPFRAAGNGDVRTMAGKLDAETGEEVGMEGHG